jgi:hypothetical protein
LNAFTGMAHTGTNAAEQGAADCRHFRLGLGDLLDRLCSGWKNFFSRFSPPTISR